MSLRPNTNILWRVGAVIGGLALAGAAASALAETPAPLPLDSETVIGGAGVACTGIGQTKDQPRWLAYPVRVEFADSQRNYLAGETLTLVDAGGAAILSVACEGPWVLLKLPAGKPYRVEAQVTDPPTAPQHGLVKAPHHGQARFVLTFPDTHP
jgi:hypothetical protein